MRLRYILILWLLLVAEAVCFSQPAEVRNRLSEYFQRYYVGYGGAADKCKLDEINIDSHARVMHIYANELFATQQFTRKKVEDIYAEVKKLLPTPYNTYRLCIYGKKVLIEELVTGGWGDESAPRSWNGIEYKGNNWVTPLNRPNDITHGLADRHIALWASHGRYFAKDKREWRWQRPRLFSTAEDLLSQTIVVPYLIPMLENAGAIVFTPRERDWQKNEVIVDNDRPAQNGLYAETSGNYPWEPAGPGFAQLKTVYSGYDNPFADGTSRCCATQTRRSQASIITWTPNIPEDGQYAVYVSYPTLPTSVSDATYTVKHRGVSTQFKVNQQMGGSTWVYLGTFDFAAGNSRDNCVMLSNQSSFRGHVSADAVRFGGGMGNIGRGDSLQVSGLPRFLEGARYYTQWAGMPWWVYANKGGDQDYAEDINARSLMTNNLARGSVYVPCDSGLCVPIDMCVALHTDAGFSLDGSHTGTLSIYTTAPNDGLLPSGVMRLASRDLSDMVVSQVDQDLKQTFGNWSRRQLYDRNYSESREPEMPSIILEMLSHQNYYDMCRAHDPGFKFTLARAIYKGILRYETTMHGLKSYVVQPLPVTALAAMTNPSQRRITLNWLAVDDLLEASAIASSFIVYHAEGQGGFDNGTLVNGASYNLESATPDVLHRFKVTAVNAGGQSMESEEVCAYISSSGSKQILVVDAFDRLAGPQPYDNDTIQGFDFNSDPGVPIAKMTGYSGAQVCFDKRFIGREGPGALGHSGYEWEGLIVAGNTRDWSTRHASDIIYATNGMVSISSCTASAVTRGTFNPIGFDVMDIAFGLQRADGYSMRQAKTFTEPLIQTVAAFTRSGGNILVSGAFIGSDMLSDAERLFTRSVLKYEFAGYLPTYSIGSIFGLNNTFSVFRTFNEKSYSVPHVDCLVATSPAFSTMVYQPSGQSAAVAYKGKDYRSIALGFPIESVSDAGIRKELMRGLMQFLLNE